MDLFENIINKISELKEKEKKIKIDENNFHEIKPAEHKKIAFIDGSNFEILASSDFSLQFVRICCIITENNKEINNTKKEFFSLTTIKNKEYGVEIFPLNYKIDNLRFNLDDKNLRVGKDNVEITKINDCVRRLAELRIAQECKAEIVVLDGSLDAKFDEEKRFLEELYKEKTDVFSRSPHEFGDKKKIVCGLSKKNDILKNDSGFVSLLNKEGTWYYDPGLECYRAKIFFVKLNEKSDYVFRFDINGNIEDVLWLLKENSKDIIFLGYPYFFVKVHKYAKISKNEKGYFLTKLRLKAGSRWRLIEKRLRSIDAHDALDMI